MAPKPIRYIDVQVTSRDVEQLAQFVKMCKTIQYLGSAGASRDVTLHVDGDGAADLHFNFGDLNVDNIDMAWDEKDDPDGDRIRIGIGV